MADRDLEGVSNVERKAFLRVLASLASADGDLDPTELELLHLTANDLNVPLGERDLETHDLVFLANMVQRPVLQQRLISELARLMSADARVDSRELSTIKFFADRWKLPLPALEGVDWTAVELP
jgi:uncharacterized tellurite resistance protein B-like protein